MACLCLRAFQWRFGGVWQRFVWRAFVSVTEVGGARRVSVDGEEGSLRRCGGGGSRRLLLAVVDGLVVAETVEARVDTAAYVTDGLARGPHVNVLNVPFKPRQRGQALVARLASVIFLGGAGATWHTIQLVSPTSRRIFNALCLS